MYFLYSLLLVVGVVLLLPRFLLDAVRHGKYAAGFRERTGRLSKVETGGRPVIWLHCVSVGETQAARPLARAILNRFPDHALVVSTTTLTGQRVAREVFGSLAAKIFYFPFDLAWSVRGALDAVRPSAVLVMETELWPRFLRECRTRRVPVAVVNGRISENSFRRYLRIKPFIRRVVDDLSLAVMQTEADAARIRDLGLAPERIKVAGNIKFDAGDEPEATVQTNELRGRFEFEALTRPLIVAASTHAPEERIVLEVFKRMTREARETHAKCPRLLIAPRHPERFAEVASLIAASGLAWTRRSAQGDERDALCDVVLLDSIGELRAVYPLADIVFVGGSIARNGGHNILEPAAAAKCVVTGAHTFNFAFVVGSFLEQGALVQLPAVDDKEAIEVLGHILRDLLADGARRQDLGERARAAFEQNRGATGRTVELLAPILERRLESADTTSARR